MEYTKTVEKGDIETPAEDDVRYFAKIALFEKILASIRGEDEVAQKVCMDGTGWEGGWGDFMTVSSNLL